MVVAPRPPCQRVDNQPENDDLNTDQSRDQAHHSRLWGKRLLLKHYDITNIYLR